MCTFSNTAKRIIIIRLMNYSKPPCGARSKILLFIIGFSFLPATLSAMELNDFVADSISAHPTIREQVHIFREVNNDQDIASSGWRPSVDLTASTGTFETESPSIGPLKRDYESSRAELAITQNLFNGFDTTYQQQQTKARASSALYEIYDTADNIALDAVQAYVDLLKQQELVKLAETNVSSHERILSQIRERSDSGVGRKSELQQTEGRVARAHAGLIAQQNNFQDAATRMHELLGRYIQPTTLKLPDLPEQSELSLEALTEIALEKHPAVRVASYNIQAALSDSSRTRNTHYPRVDLRLAKEVGDNINGFDGDTDDLSLVLNLSFNLYRGGADQAEVRKKISVVHQNQEFSAQVRRQIINTLRLAWMADQSLSSQLKYLSTHIEKARQTVASYGEEFFIGQRDLVDLLDAESELNTAKNQHTTAFHDALSARFRILEAMGVLLPALNLDVSVGEYDLQISKVQSAEDGESAAQAEFGSANKESQPGLSQTIKVDDNLHTPAVVVGAGYVAPQKSNQSQNTDTTSATDTPALQASGEDTLPLDTDRDADKKENVTDHCDNTQGNSLVDSYGCRYQRGANFGYGIVNQVPVMGDDLLKLEMNSVLVITQSMLLENDTDADNDALRLIDFTQPKNGVLAFDNMKNIIYRADDGFSGIDKFTYSITDGQGAVATATVKLDISPRTQIQLSKTQFVNFMFESSKLTPESQSRVNSIVEMIKNLPHVGIEIYAYTDNIGNDQYNLALSERRATAARELLISYGIDGNRIKAFGMGEKNPMADNATDAGRSINRRGEIQFKFGSKVK